VKDRPFTTQGIVMIILTFAVATLVWQLTHHYRWQRDRLLRHLPAAYAPDTPGAGQLPSPNDA
jgi:hypothetical protein